MRLCCDAVVSVSTDVAAQLLARFVTLGVPGFVLGTNLRVGQVQVQGDGGIGAGPAVPAKCIFIQATTGITDEPMHDGTTIKKWGIMVTIRGAARKWVETETLASDTFTALDKFPPAGYFESRAPGSYPNFVREDDAGFPTWTINLILQKRE